MKNEWKPVCANIIINVKRISIIIIQLSICQRKTIVDRYEFVILAFAKVGVVPESETELESTPRARSLSQRQSHSETHRLCSPGYIQYFYFHCSPRCQKLSQNMHTTLMHVLGIGGCIHFQMMGQKGHIFSYFRVPRVTFGLKGRGQISFWPLDARLWPAGTLQPSGPGSDTRCSLRFLNADIIRNVYFKEQEPNYYPLKPRPAVTLLRLGHNTLRRCESCSSITLGMPLFQGLGYTLT